MRGKDFFIENMLLDCLLAIWNLRKRTFFIELIELDDEEAHNIFKAVTKCLKNVGFTEDLLRKNHVSVVTDK